MDSSNTIKSSLNNAIDEYLIDIGFVLNDTCDYDQ